MLSIRVAAVALAVLFVCGQAHSDDAPPAAPSICPGQLRRVRHEKEDIAPADMLSTGVRAVIGVFSSAMDPKFRARRDLIRQTWGAYATADIGLELVFVMTYTLDKDQFAALDEEHQTHKDLLLVKNTSAPGMAAYKTFAFLTWAIDSRPDITFLAKLDEDVYLHPFKFRYLLASLKHTRTYWGRLELLTGVAPAMVHYMSKEMWVVSADILGWVLRERTALAGAPQYAHEPDHAVLVGRLVAGQGIALAELQAAGPAAPWELYDWGPDADQGKADPDADLGLLPPETIAVHRLKSSASFLQIHDLLVGSVMRWSACAKAKYTHPNCQLLLGGQYGLNV